MQLLCTTCDEKKKNKIIPAVMEEYISVRLKQLQWKEQNRVKYLKKAI